MHVLVSDTSVFIDLERGGPVEISFTLPYRFAVPDVMYDRELKDHGVLWVFDQLHRTGLVPAPALCEALTALSKHSRCRLPKPEIRKRLKTYRPASE